MILLGVLFLSIGGMFQSATVVQMDLTDCVSAQHSILETLAGTPGVPQRTSCAEYVLTSPTVVFRLQAKRSETLLVPGEVVSYRTGKGKLYLRRDDGGGELETTVTCMRSIHSPGDTCGAALDRLDGGLQKTAMSASR